MGEDAVLMYIKKGDTVMVLAGKEKGKTGKVLKVNPKKQTVVVEKVNFIKRHTRPTKKAPQGGIIEKEGPIHVSNVNLVCPKCTTHVRIRKRILDDGRKVRACVKCGEILDQ